MILPSAKRLASLDKKRDVLPPTVMLYQVVRLGAEFPISHLREHLGSRKTTRTAEDHSQIGYSVKAGSRG